MNNFPTMKRFNFKTILSLTLTIGLIAFVSSCKSDSVDLLETTLPVEFERALIESNLPYELDGFGGAYHPNQLVVKFKPGVSLAVRNDILINVLGAFTTKECLCGDVLTLSTFDQAGLNERGGLEGIKQKANDENEIEEITFNYYNFNQVFTFNPPTIIGTPFENQAGATSIIAVVDVGVDYGPNTNLQNYLLGNGSEANDGLDDDGNCLTDDMIGWDFTNEDNDPTDDHGHGTHVANTIINQIEEWDPTGILQESIKILPLKTHNDKGVGNLFNVSCAIIYAADRGADIINASWGFYAEEVPEILLQSIEYAFNVSGAILITSMGNENINLDSQNHYPSNLELNNIIPVGATNENGAKAEFSNYYTNGFENVFAPGTNIVSNMPGWYPTSTEAKSGTSMATAYVSATAAYVLEECGTNSKNDILNEIKNGLLLENGVEGGNNYNFYSYEPSDFIPCP